MTVRVPVTTAALGGAMDIPTLEGTMALKIPEGTQSGRIIRVRGQGVPNVHGRGRGDLLVSVQVVTPTKLTRRQKQIIESLRQELG